MNNKEKIKINISAAMEQMTEIERHEFLGCLVMSADSSDEDIRAYSDIAESSTFRAVSEYFGKLDQQEQKQLIDELIMISSSIELRPQKSKDLKDLASMDTEYISEFLRDNPGYFAD